MFPLNTSVAIDEFPVHRSIGRPTFAGMDRLVPTRLHRNIDTLGSPRSYRVVTPVVLVRDTDRHLTVSGGHYLHAMRAFRSSVFAVAMPFTDRDEGAVSASDDESASSATSSEWWRRQTELRERVRARIQGADDTSTSGSSTSSLPPLASDHEAPEVLNAAIAEQYQYQLNETALRRRSLTRFVFRAVRIVGGGRSAVAALGGA